MQQNNYIHLSASTLFLKTPWNVFKRACVEIFLAEYLLNIILDFELPLLKTVQRTLIYIKNLKRYLFFGIVSHV